MEVSASFLADYAKTDASNKVNALGVFGYTEAEEFPAKMPQFYWVITLNAVRTELLSPVTVQMSLTGGVPETTVFSQTVEVDSGEIGDPGHFISANMVFGFSTLVLPSTGRYVFDVRVNDKAHGQTVLYATTPAKEAEA